MTKKVRIYLVSLAFGFFLIGVVKAADSVTLTSAKQAAPMLIINGDGTLGVDAANNFTKVEFRAYDDNTKQTTLVNASADPAKGTWVGTVTVPAKADYDVTAMLYTVNIKTKISNNTPSNKITVQVK